MLVVGPEIPASLRPFALSIVEAIRSLQTPRAPTALFACDTASMPPAAAWANHALSNTSLNVIAVSDGVNWIRQDTGAAI